MEYIDASQQQEVIMARSRSLHSLIRLFFDGDTHPRSGNYSSQRRSQAKYAPKDTKTRHKLSRKHLRQGNPQNQRAVEVFTSRRVMGYTCQHNRIHGGRTMQLGDILAQKLEERGWSQNRLAKESGITQAQVSRLLNGKSRNLTLETLRMLAQGLGCATVDLLPEEDKRPRAALRRFRKTA